MDLDDAIRMIQENSGCAYEVEILPRCIDGSITWRATIKDEYGECADGVGADIAEAISELAGDFWEWLEEQTGEEQ